MEADTCRAIADRLSNIVLQTFSSLLQRCASDAILTRLFKASDMLISVAVAWGSVMPLMRVSEASTPAADPGLHCEPPAANAPN